MPVRRYHTHGALVQELRYLAAEFPEVAKLYSLGQTAAGRDIPCLKLAADCRAGRPLLRPQVPLTRASKVKTCNDR